MGGRRSQEGAPSPELDAFAARGREILAVVLVGLGIYMLLSLATFALPHPGETAIPRDGLRNLGGAFGHLLAHGFLVVFGLASWLLFLFVVAYGGCTFAAIRIERIVLKVLGVVVLTAMMAILFAGADGLAGITEQSPHGAGGRVGSVLSPRLARAFGEPGRMMLVLFGALVSLVLATEWLISTLLRRAYVGLQWLFGRVRVLQPAFAGAEMAEADARPARKRLPRVKIATTSEAGAVDEVLSDATPDDTASAEGAATTPATPTRGRSARARALARDPGESLGDTTSSKESSANDRSAGDDGAGDDGAGNDREPADIAAPVDAVAAEVVEADDEEDADDATGKARTVAAKAAARRPARPRSAGRKRGLGVQPELPFDAVYPFPPLDLFRERETDDDDANAGDVERNCEAIERKLGSFNIGAKVVHVSTGPAVTQYEIRLDDGIKVSKIVSFEPDLAACLRAVAVRVVAPIPGKDTVGIEVPNEHRQMVFMRELMEADRDRPEQAIPLFLGKDVAGEPIVEDLARMPHILIAGTTGSGKSVCINAILLSILMTRSPRQVRLILIDPKMVELQAYKAVPHLACDVVTNMKKAPGVLQWAVDEMERRYALFSAAGVNHIASFNKLGKAELEKRLQRPMEAEDAQLPYMVLVIDELADLMAVSQSEVEEYIQRLAQKSRAVGLHVILATQRPSTDVITGVIKANLPCQIAFKVNRKIDSRVILDANGAEKLLGHGDMLYVPPGANKLVRAQGAFVSDTEIQRVVQFLAEKGQKPSFLPDLVQSKTGSHRGPADKDDMYEKAVEVILGQQRGSATLLQRALAVGYTRATRLLELMEEDGLVGGFNGSKSRDVMMTLDDWREREQAIAEELDRIDAGEILDGEPASEEDAEESTPEDAPIEEAAHLYGAGARESGARAADAGPNDARDDGADKNESGSATR